MRWTSVDGEDTAASGAVRQGKSAVECKIFRREASVVQAVDVDIDFDSLTYVEIP